MKYAISALILVISLAAGTPVQAAKLAGGALIKAADPAVYLVTATGGRMAFPNAATYFTWYRDFSGVRTVSSSELASYPLTGNVTYKPGVKMLKLDSAPTVYAVSAGGVLRPIATGAVAAALYGADWSRRVDSLPDAFFSNYKMGAPVASASDFSPSSEMGSSAASSSVPANVTASAIVGPASQAGRMMSVAVDPTNSDVAYAGSASGGIFKTSDRGATWKPVSDALGSMHISAIAVDPSDPAVVYAGTGEIYMPGDDYGYMGIYASSDRGATWKILGTTAELPLRAASSVTVDPKNSEHLFVSGNSGVYESKDSGASWNRIFDGYIDSFLISSAASGTYFAVGAGTTVVRSTDAGAHWEKLAGWNVKRGLPDDNPWFNRATITQSSGKSAVSGVSHVLYVALADPFMVFRSDNEGDGWHEVAKQPYEGMRNYALMADPADADVVYTAGNTLHRASDGGWTVKLAPTHGFGVRALAYAPSDSRIIYAATDSGMEVSSDNGITWTAKNAGLGSSQWHSVAVSRDGSTVLGAVQGGSVARYSAGKWTGGSWGEARELIADPTASRVAYAVSADKGIGRSADGGQSFFNANGSLPAGIQVAAFAVDPTAGSNLFFASGANLYSSRDSGASWYSLGSNGSYSPIKAIAVGAAPHLVFVGRADGTVSAIDAFGTNVSHPAWKAIYSEPNSKPVAALAAYGNGLMIGFDVDWGTRIVTLSAGGPSWTPNDSTGDLPANAWVRSLAIDPSNPNVAYVGHLAGAFRGYSADGRNWSWQRVSGIPSVEVTGVAVSPNAAYFATWGRGLYQASK